MISQNPILLYFREPLIYFSMSRVAVQTGKIATRTAQVVAGTTMPSRRRGHVGIDQRFPKPRREIPIWPQPACKPIAPHTLHAVESSLFHINFYTIEQ